MFKGALSRLLFAIFPHILSNNVPGKNSERQDKNGSRDIAHLIHRIFSLQHAITSLFFSQDETKSHASICYQKMEEVKNKGFCIINKQHGGVVMNFQQRSKVRNLLHNSFVDINFDAVSVSSLVNTAVCFTYVPGRVFYSLLQLLCNFEILK